MELEHLRLFLHLSQTLHFGKTSEVFHVSPSTLSRIIKRLEEEVGQPLLERDNRTVQIAPMGIKFRDFAAETLERWGRFEQEVPKDNQSLSGELRLYCSVTASYSILSPILGNFRKRYPKIEIKLRTGDVAQAIPNVLEGIEDIAIAAKPDRLPPKLDFETLTLSPLHFIAPVVSCNVNTQLAKKRVQWDRIPMILSERGIARQRTERWFQQKGMHPNIYAQVSGNEAIVSMVSLGFGVGVVPHLVVESSPVNSKIRVLEVRPELEPFLVGICTLQRKRSNPLVQAFWEVTLAAFQEKRLRIQESFNSGPLP